MGLLYMVTSSDSVEMFCLSFNTCQVVWVIQQNLPPPPPFLSLSPSLGSLAEWLADHPVMLSSVLPLVLEALGNPDLSVSSVSTLKKICRECKYDLPPYATNIVAVSQVRGHCFHVMKMWLYKVLSGFVWHCYKYNILYSLYPLHRRCWSNRSTRSVKKGLVVSLYLSLLVYHPSSDSSLCTQPICIFLSVINSWLGSTILVKQFPEISYCYEQTSQCEQSLCTQTSQCEQSLCTQTSQCKQSLCTQTSQCKQSLCTQTSQSVSSHCTQTSQHVSSLFLSLHADQSVSSLFVSLCTQTSQNVSSLFLSLHADQSECKQSLSLSAHRPVSVCGWCRPWASCSPPFRWRTSCGICTPSSHPISSSWRSWLMRRYALSMPRAVAIMESSECMACFL